MWIILLDHSGSMGDPFTGKQTFVGRSKASTATIKLEAAKNALFEHLLSLGTPNRVALIQFTSTASIIFEGSSSDVETIQRVLSTLAPDDGTDIAVALDEAAKYVATMKRELVIRVLVISDGLSKYEPALKAAQNLAAHGVLIDLILIDPTDEGERVGRAIAIDGMVTGVYSAQQLSDTVAIAKELERQQVQEVAKLVQAYETEKARVADVVPSEERLSFTTGYPGTVSPGVWNSLLIYLHTARWRERVAEMLQKEAALHNFHPSISTTNAVSLISRQTLLKLVPHLDGFTFNPPGQEVTWLEDIQEASFRLQAGIESAGRVVLGSVDVYAGPLFIAQLPLSITVQGREKEESIESTIASAQIFSSIFASYSHLDSGIVQACAAAYRALGISMYIDKDSLRSGNYWQRTLHKFIEDADVFQLYWSDAAKESLYVQDEWEYALPLRGLKGEQFVRPLHWEEPLPTPPSELASLHFAKLDLDALSKQTGFPTDSAEQQSPPPQTPPVPGSPSRIYATVLPTLAGTTEMVVTQAREAAAFAIRFLEETTELRYYPAPTLLVDRYAVQSIRAHATIDTPPQQEGQKDLALALSDVLHSVCLDFHVRGFCPSALPIAQLDEAFGKGDLLSEPQFDMIRRLCEGASHWWIVNYFDSPWTRSRDLLSTTFPTIGKRLSDFLVNALGYFIKMLKENGSSNRNQEFVTLYRRSDAHFLPLRELEQAGLTIDQSGDWTNVKGTRQAFIQALERLREELALTLPRYNTYDSTQAKGPDGTGSRCLAMGNIVGAICHELIRNRYSNFSFSQQPNAKASDSKGLTKTQGEMLIEQSSHADNWIQEVLQPLWRETREELLALNMGEFSSGLDFTAFLGAFFGHVHRLLHTGQNTMGSFTHKSGYSIQKTSWQLLRQEIPDLQLIGRPVETYRGNAVNLSGEFSEFIRVFDLASKRLTDILRDYAHYPSSGSRFFATEVATFGIYAPSQSPAIDEILYQWAFKQGISRQLTLPQSPRVLLSLNAQKKFEEQLKEEGYGSQECTKLAELFQRCVLIHEHFHAILETGLDHQQNAAPGVRFADAWQSAQPLNESLAVWMELHFARDKPEMLDLVESYIHSGPYPRWPYRGAEYIERIYQEQGIEAVRKLLNELRQDPRTAQAQFDALWTGQEV